MLIRILSILMWLVVTPFCCGLSITRYMRKECQNLTMIMVTGYFLMLALFQIIYIPFIVFFNHFKPLVIVYGAGSAVFAVFSLVLNGKYWMSHRKHVEQMHWSTYALWMLALALIGFQLYKTVFYQFHDGDDAFFAVTSVITYQNNNMYVKLPYTGEASTLDVRHAFSSAPIFISFLAGTSGIHPAIVTHVIFACAVLVLFYMLIKLIADILVDKRYVPFFLILVSIMNVFGNNTIYTSSTFLLTRTSQGKAFMGNIIPAAAILGLLLVWKELLRETSVKQRVAPWILLSCVMVTAGYTSLLGLVLTPMLIVCATVLFAFLYRRPKILLPCVFSMIPVVVMGALYATLLIG